MASTNDQIKSDMKAAYDAIAPRYQEWTASHHSDRLKYLNRLLTYLEPQSSPRILELGCGAGDPTTKILAELPDSHVTANDISSTQISMAKEFLASANNIDFVEGDMNALEFEDQSLDVAVAMYSIIHLPRLEQTELIGKIAKWLKPGAYVLMNVGSAAFEASVEKNWLEQKGADVFWSSWSPEEYEAIFEKVGLDVVEKEISDGKDDAVFIWVILQKKS